MVQKLSLMLAFAQMIFITSAKPKEETDFSFQMPGKVEHDSNPVKRWAPIDVHVGHLLRTLHQKMLEEILKNHQNNRSNNRSRSVRNSEGETLEELLQDALQNSDHDMEERKNNGHDLLYPINIVGPVQNMSRLILNTLREIHDQQLRDGYIGRPNPVRMIG